MLTCKAIRNKENAQVRRRKREAVPKNALEGISTKPHANKKNRKMKKRERKRKEKKKKTEKKT